MLRDILDPKSSIYLDASAGSGKTKLLVDRIIKVLLSGTRPSRILCITFTKAAADEMYERLEEIILSFVILEEEALKAKLLELDCPIRPNVIREARGLFALLMEEKPLIQTIHAFCAKILQKLNLIEEEEAEEGGKILEEEERKKLFEEVFFRLMVDSKDLNDRVKFLLEEYDIKYLIELLEAFWISLSNSRTNLIKYDLPQVELEQFLSELLNRKLHMSHEEQVQIAPDNPQELLMVLEKLDQDAINLNFLTTNNLQDFSNYKGIFLTKEGKARARLVPAKIGREHPEIEDILRKEQARLIMVEESLLKLEAFKKNLAINLFTWELLAAFHNKKKEKNLLEYSDLIVTTMSLLSGGQALGLLYNLDLKLEQLLIDEAQDLSEIQWALIQIITDEFFAGEGASDKVRTIFIVGDFKQAIFGFQGAAPEIFQAIKKYYREKITALGQKWCQLQLDTCYRCVPEVLDLVDNFCNQDYAQEAFKVREKIQHKAYKEAGLGFVKLEEVIIPPLQEKSKEWLIPGLEEATEEEDESFFIAQAIVDKIADWLQNNRCYGPNLPVKPQSILILLRKRSRLQDLLVKKLEEAEIPVTNLAAKATSYPRILYYFIAIIQFIVQPLDDMNLFALVQEEPFNLSEEELFNLAYNRQASLWEAVAEKMPLLQNIRSKALELDLQAFIYYFFEEIYQVHNKEREDFLNYFLAYSREATTLSYQDFLLWLESTLQKKRKKIYDNQSVRITTVHSAKGLEAPIVILADPSFSEKTGFKRFAQSGPLLILNSKTTKKLVEEAEEAEERERIRLLYVALTRPQYELHIFGKKG